VNKRGERFSCADVPLRINSLIPDVFMVVVDRDLRRPVLEDSGHVTAE